VITSQQQRAGGAFSSSAPEIDRVIEANMDIINGLDDLDKMEAFELRLTGCLQVLTAKERAKIREIRERERSRNQQLERAKKLLRASGIVMMEEEEV